MSKSRNLASAALVFAALAAAPTNANADQHTTISPALALTSILAGLVGGGAAIARRRKDNDNQPK